MLVEAHTQARSVHDYQRAPIVYKKARIRFALNAPTRVMHRPSGRGVYTGEYARSTSSRHPTRTFGVLFDVVTQEEQKDKR